MAPNKWQHADQAAVKWIYAGRTDSLANPAAASEHELEGGGSGLQDPNDHAHHGWFQALTTDSYDKGESR